VVGPGSAVPAGAHLAGLWAGIAGLLLLAGIESGRAQGQIPADTASLQKIRVGTAASALQPIVIDILVAEHLGYLRAEGLTAEVIPLGSSAAALAALDRQRIEFYSTSAAFILPLVARGENVRSINFFEAAYPFRYALAVNPDSAIRSFGDLKGKLIGVSGFGLADYPVGRLVMKTAGLDPDKDISWLAVGEGAKAALPLQRGNIEALFTFSSSFGVMEGAGLQLRYLTLPSGVPHIGGFYYATSPDTLRSHRDWAIGFGRAIAKSHVFIRENPEAASFIFGSMVPEALPKGKPLQEQVRAIMVPVKTQMRFYVHYDPSIQKLGYIKESEWRDEIEFVGLQNEIKDVTRLFTNDLIDEINQFDAATIREDARSFKLPYEAKEPAR
jgi:NitT/TauT family transport system substrate-binding protein